MAEEMSDQEQQYGSHIARRPRMSDQVADQLRDEILRRDLRPGDKLPSERVLGEQFGVSRTVIREAVRALVAKGLVDVVTGSGLRVAAVDASNVVESMQIFIKGQDELDYAKLHEVRAVLELATVERAAERATDEDIGQLFALCDEMAANLDDIAVASRVDLEFHRVIAQACDNDLFVVLHDVLEAGLMEARRATFEHDPERMARVVTAHRRIAERIQDRDPAAARSQMLEHLDDVRRTWDLARHDAPPDA